ncbi:MAG TPA: hypothetical protein VEM13_05620 [Gemmatimonadales bacterium]|nr:hypothetical protein [Gemmatimonadales bacterium]
MNAHETRTLAERIEQLERDYRRLRRGAAALVGVLVLSALTAAVIPPPRVVTAERFVLQQGGAELGSLEVTDRGPRLRLHASEDEAVLGVGPLGAVGLRLSADRDGLVSELSIESLAQWVSLSFHGRSREGRLEARFTPRNESPASIELYSGKGPDVAIASNDSGALVLVSEGTFRRRILTQP